MMTVETPSEEVERSSSIPLIVLTASSILSEISVSTSSGEAPGRRVTIVTAIRSDEHDALGVGVADKLSGTDRQHRVSRR